MTADQTPAPDGDDQPDLDDSADGPWHDFSTFDTQACLREIREQPLPDDLVGVVALTHALRTHDGPAAARLLADLMDPDEYGAHQMLALACHLLGCVADEQGISTEVFGRWAQVAKLRMRCHG